ncbi:MAG: PQQ-binding-like beta-propeller repeat protein, partial [Planctomycetaceae bacterium]
GKSGVVAYDLAGKKLWQTSVGTESGPMGWGSGASPLIYKNLVIVNASEENEAIVALDKSTGKQKWKAQAAGLGSCWGTPVLVKTKDRTDLVISVPNEIWGLNPDTGKLVWYADGLQSRTMCASLVVDKDVVIAVGGQGSGSIAVRCGGKGNVTKTHTVWTSQTSGRINTPVLFDGYVHWVGYGIVQCLAAKDGKTAYRKRLGGGGGNRAGGNPGGGSRGGGRFGGGGRQFGGGRFGGGQTYNSPIVVNGNIVMFTRNGTAHVYKGGKQFKLVSTNKLTDGSDFNASPAIADGQMFIRSNKYLYCIEATR